jgi:ferredoxin
MRKQSSYTKSARGKECDVRVQGVCNHNPETTVLAHLNGGGMAAKHYDIHGAYACSDCHTWLDGGYVKTSTRNERDLHHLEAVIRTQTAMINDGVLVI